MAKLLLLCLVVGAMSAQETAPQPPPACAPVGTVWFYLQTVFALLTLGGVFIVIDLLRDRKQITAAVHAAVTAERQRCLLLVEVAKQRRTLHHDPGRRDFEILAAEIRDVGERGE